MEAQKDNSKDMFAFGALALGIISLCTWLVPLCGCPTTIGGLVLGYLGLESNQRNLAIVGMVISGLALVITLINAAWGAYMGATGQLDFGIPQP